MLAGAVACGGPKGDAARADSATPGTPGTPGAPAPGTPDAQMQQVLDQLAALGGRPIETLTPAEARRQPSPSDAVKALLVKQGKDTTSTALVPGVTHEFFGKGAVLDEARDAVGYAGERLRKAFGA